MNKMKNACYALLLVVSAAYSNEVVTPQLPTEKEFHDSVNGCIEQIREVYKDYLPAEVLESRIKTYKEYHEAVYSLTLIEEKCKAAGNCDISEEYKSALDSFEKLAEEMELISKDLQPIEAVIRQRVDPLNMGQNVVTPQIPDQLIK